MEVKELSSRFSSKVVMIQPAQFEFNQETGSDNVFMNNASPSGYLAQFLEYKKRLIDYGISVDHWVNSNPEAKDCIFANNWFITLSPPDVNINTLVICPMKHPSRRLERAPEFIETLSKLYPNIINLADYESQNIYLEGTGSLVIDRLNKQIFMSISERSSPRVLNILIQEINSISNTPWTGIVFNSIDEFGSPIYHTNVILSLTPSKAVINIESILPKDRSIVLEALKNYEIVQIDYSHTRKFAGNLEVLYSPTLRKNIIFMSGQARDLLELDCEVVYVDISVIENIGGGSTQCMLGKLF